jgi:hypothetical protein
MTTRGREIVITVPAGMLVEHIGGAWCGRCGKALALVGNVASCGHCPTEADPLRATGARPSRTDLLETARELEQSAGMMRDLAERPATSHAPNGQPSATYLRRLAARRERVGDWLRTQADE